MAARGTPEPEGASGFGQHFLFTDRPPAAEGTEDDSETAWAEFQQLALGPLPSVAAHAAGAKEAPVAPAPAPVTIEGLLSLATRDGRVCPQPAEWLRLYDMLPAMPDRPPAPPVRRAEWQSTSAVAKRMCLEVHLEWAVAHGAGPQVGRFLAQLQEPQWHHRGGT